MASVSCAEAGDCTIGGSYSDDRHNNIPWVAGQPTSIFPRAYLAQEVNGLWGTPVPAIIDSDLTLTPSILRSVACGRTDPTAPTIFCAASGTYFDSAGHEHAMIGFGTAPAPSQWGAFGDVLTVPGTHDGSAENTQTVPGILELNTAGAASVPGRRRCRAEQGCMRTAADLLRGAQPAVVTTTALRLVWAVIR